MNAAKQLAKDLKISPKAAKKAVSQLSQIIDDVSSVEELVERLEAAVPNGKVQFIVLSGLMAMSEQAGKYRGGTPTLADEILDRMSKQVGRYGDRAYRLSEKQVKVVARDAWAWLRPEMRQGV